ncbi:MAG TPA: glycosyltransferase [Vicinamibacterales bacterium]|nr:glycosyltransferase [Vicinamibacterales bacterium]
MTKTRVVRIIARMNVGGPAIHATLLTRDLDPDRYESHLVVGAEAPGEGNYLDMHGWRLDRVHTVPALGREISPWRDARALGDLGRLLRQIQPHIVHTHTAKAGMLGRMAARRAGVPIVVHTFHGHVFDGYFSPLKTAAFVRIERMLARRTTRLVTVSEEVRRQILARGIGRADRFDVIRLGLDLSSFVRSEERRGELRRELGLPGEAETVGIVARLVPIKAHEVFLDVAARLAAARPRAVFIIAGDGERRSELDAAAHARGLDDRVHFLGWRSDLDRIYADLDVVMLTSKNEGSPVALIEAMAAGRPVVATRAGGVEELVGEAGLLADVGDAATLARHAATRLDDRARAGELGARARARVVPAYSHERLVADVDRLYTRLLADAGR